MMDRREILKRFGIGAVIVPVIGGAAVTNSAVELIEVPKVRPVELFRELPKPLDLSKITKVTVTCQFADGKTRTMEADNLFCNGHIEPSDRLDLFIQFSDRIASPARTIGEIYGNANLL